MSDENMHRTLEGPLALSLTERAAARIKEIVGEHGFPHGAGLRAGVTEGGCSGFNYEVEVEEAPRPDDTVFERHGARVFVDPRSAPYINGITIDWTSSMQESRFVFQNPNATGTCGCGESFSV